jgi:hypothetical protein
MSHNKERAEKICLNCGTNLEGRYCHVCGQENLEPKENFGHLINHFFQDVTHFDGKFFSTLRLLLFKPGFLTTEYLKGRRVSYLHPVRMYIFTAFVFFFVLFSSRQSRVVTIDKKPEPAQNSKVVFRSIDSTSSLVKLNFSGQPKTIKEYDSLQSVLPADERDNWFTSRLAKKAILLGGDEFENELVEKFTHDIPKMMFVFLPLVALVLQLLYFRKRKEFYYVSHGIFVIHFYIAAYILMLVSMLFGWLEGLSHWRIFTLLQAITVLTIFFYLYKAMRNFYHQRRGKTILKFMIFNIAVLVLFVLLSTILFAISLYEVT